MPFQSVARLFGLAVFVSTMMAAPVPALADAIEGKQGPAEILAGTTPEDWRAVAPEDTLVIDLARGRIVIELSRDLAAGHVAQMKELARAGFYDGLSFYRVIEGFVAQGGDVFETRDLPPGAVRGLPAAFDEAVSADLISMATETTRGGYAPVAGYLNGMPTGWTADGSRAWHLHCAGALAMARNVPQDTAGTEFYITLQPQRYLDRNLTVFGRVIDGMTHLQALTRQAPPEAEGEPLGEVINAMWVGDQPPEGARAPAFEVLRTAGETFTRFVESRRNRPEDFFYHRPDYLDVCALGLPVRPLGAGE